MTPESVIAKGAVLRPELTKYVVAVRVNRAWEPVSPSSLQKAHDRYDAGTVELVHQRISSEAYLLLAIPRTKRVKRRLEQTFKHARTLAAV